jgi:cobalt/nickel transport system permease protein
MRIAAFILLAALVITRFAWTEEKGGWEGVDKTVVEKFAKSSGVEPSKPLIDTDRGDLLLFLFLLAGMVGGFVIGYNFRSLFGPREGASGPAGGNEP